MIVSVFKPLGEAALIVHVSLDIKPDNILLNLDTSGAKVLEAKLADCGKFRQLMTSSVLQCCSQCIHQAMHKMSVSRLILAAQLTL